MEYTEFKRKYHIELNEQQEAAVQSIDGAVLLLAVPGSGKTTVLVARLGYMIFCKNINPESILTVTYTVAATSDMKKRFEKKFGSEYVSRLEFRTINGISQKILQYFGQITGRKPFQVADKETSGIIKKIFHDVTGQFATEIDIKNIQTAITYVKNMRLTEEEIYNLEVEIDDFPKIYENYNVELRKQKKIDYDDQMVYALRILEQFPNVLNYFQEKYKYLCVDEAQDTSKIQHDMINLLASKDENLFMVGDEDQSIYGFRAAYPQALVSFENVHEGAKVLLMESNYRSRQEIVVAADRFIQANKNRHEKHMKATRADGGKVVAIEAKGRKGQFNYLAKVAENCDRETAVLYRNNESALPLIDILERKGISYRLKKNEMTFFSHPVVSDICDFMRLAIAPCDEEVFLRIYYKLGAGISRNIANSIIESNRGEKALIDILCERREVPYYIKKQCKPLSTHFKNMVGEDAGKAIYRILHYMGYSEYMDDHGLDSGKADILKMLAEQESSIESFLDRLNFLNEITSNGREEYNSKFVLSTVHSSKGLEYDRVYMMDMLEGILPSCDEPKGKDVLPEEIDAYEEERRMYYVGMTRAKNELYIFTFNSYDTSRFSKAVFVNEKKSNKKSNIENMLSEYEMGIIVWHEKYGKGVVVDRDGEVAEILFDNQIDTKKFSLPYAVTTGALRVSE